MRDILVNKKINKDIIISMEQYEQISPKYEFILYSDNILEGITLLNMLTEEDDILKIKCVVYDPNDQPIYLFQDDFDKLYAIKICGAYDKWELPQIVSDIINFVDLPDYIFYSIPSGTAILAGENTETASVGNSQWQREGRKVGAARAGVPFIYQTFYSGRDESLDNIREPNSLQVYNQILYSIRYKVPSFVAYFENNFEGATTRKRTPIDGEKLFSRYIKSIIVADVNKDAKKELHKIECEFFVHMFTYLKEGKYSHAYGISSIPRLKNDFPIINNKVYNSILQNTTTLAKDLVSYIYGEKNDFLSIYPFDDIVKENMEDWSGYKNKLYIKDLISYLSGKSSAAKSYISGQAKVGIASTKLCKQYLISKFPCNQSEFLRILDDEIYPESVLLPLRIHKYSNDIATFSPDPESGEIVAFGELFGNNSQCKKTRPVIGYVIVDTPNGFNFEDKVGTKLYNALAHYVDILIFDNSKVITKFDLPAHTCSFLPLNFKEVIPNELTEEVAVVSTYLNLSQISAAWQLCFIHTHHSSWQQLVIYTMGGSPIQHKIDRKSTKVDLIMQDHFQKKGLFMVAEGKNSYYDLIADKKIRKAMQDAGALIDHLYNNTNTKFDAFIYNLNTVAYKDPSYYVQMEVEKINGALDLGHFDDIAHEKNFVIIIVYNDEHGKTKFSLVYSKEFDLDLQQKIEKEFS